MFFTCCNSASISTENRVPAFYSVQTSSDSCVVEQSKLMDEIINLKLLTLYAKLRKKDEFTYHKLQFSLYVCPVKNLFPFLSQVPERKHTDVWLQCG